MENQTKSLRIRYSHIRDEISSLDREEKSNLISQCLYNLILSSGRKDILCFYPLGSEVSLLLLYNRLINEGYNLFFPITNNNLMDFYKVSNLTSDFTLGEYKIMVPKARNIKYSYEEFPEVFCITPGLVFDENLNRIGYGKGFYDRFLSTKPLILKCGVCFNEQLSTEIIPGEFDVPLDYVVTDKHTYRKF